MQLAVLVSGSGTILDAIIEHAVPVALVLADRPCAALDKARRAGVAAELVERDDFSPSFDREAYTEQVVKVLAAHDIDLVAMAGFGTIFTGAIQRDLPDRILNTHPALLPSFPGWHAVRDALAHGVKVTGCTVHVAGVEVDTGPILAQEAVPVLDDDTVESLHERIKEVERRLYPDTIAAVLARGSVLA